MKIGISINLDVTKIEKARLVPGKKGTYLDLTAFVDLDNKDQYDNNGFISQSVSAEEREQKVQTPILGNVKVFWSDGPSAEQYAKGTAQAKAAMDPEIIEDDLPF